MSFFIGFLVAVAVGLTGIGGGSFTVPALVLIVGLTAGEAVGTAFVFAGVLRLVAAPFYLLGKRFHARYLWLLLLGAIPGLVLGTFVLRLLGEEGGNPVVVIVLGIVLAASSSVTFAPRHSAGRIFKRDVCSPRPESSFRSEELPMVTMAGAPHRGGSRILIRRSRCTGDCSAFELFGNDASPGCWYGPCVWLGARSDRRGISLEVWHN